MQWGVQGYWMSAIAARPSSTHKGYLLGGLVWFAVPFSLATSLGLGALALDLPITAAEAARGLVPPATATALMGKFGSVLLLTMLALHGGHLGGLGGAGGRLLPLHLRHLQDLHQPGRHRQADPPRVQGRRPRVRLPHGRPRRHPQPRRRLPGMDVPGHGRHHRLRRHPHRAAAALEQGQRRRRHPRQSAPSPAAPSASPSG